MLINELTGMDPSEKNTKNQMTTLCRDPREKLFYSMCDSSNFFTDSRTKRDTVEHNPPPIIDYDDWTVLRISSPNLNRPTMIVVAEAPGIKSITNNSKNDSGKKISEISDNKYVSRNEYLPTAQKYLLNSTVNSITISNNAARIASLLGENDDLELTEKKSLILSNSPIMPVISKPIRDYRQLSTDANVDGAVSAFSPSKLQQNTFPHPTDLVTNIVNIINRIAPVLPAFVHVLRSTKLSSEASTMKSFENPLRNLLLSSNRKFHPVAHHLNIPSYSSRDSILSNAFNFENNTDTAVTASKSNKSGEYPLIKSLKLRKLQTNSFGIERTIKLHQITRTNHFSHLSNKDIKMRYENKKAVSEQQQQSAAVSSEAITHIQHSKDPGPKLQELFANKIYPISEKYTNIKTFNKPILHTINSQAINVLSSGEIRKIKEIHKKLFNIQNERKKLHENHTSRVKEVLLANQPKFIIEKRDIDAFLNSEDSERIQNVLNQLPKDVVEDLQMLKTIPNPKELLDGLDLNLMNENNGFDQLKKQIIDRFLRRKIGLYP